MKLMFFTGQSSFVNDSGLLIRMLFGLILFFDEYFFLFTSSIYFRQRLEGIFRVGVTEPLFDLSELVILDRYLLIMGLTDVHKNYYISMNYQIAKLIKI